MIGSCRQCQGILCWRGNHVACSTCGLPVEDHELNGQAVAPTVQPKVTPAAVATEATEQRRRGRPPKVREESAVPGLMLPQG